MGCTPGLSRIGAMLLSVYPSQEAVVYWIMVTIIEGIAPTYYVTDMLGAVLDVSIIQEMLLRVHPAGSRILTALGSRLKPLLMSWLLNLYIDEVSQEALPRLWDLFLAYGRLAVLWMAVSILAEAAEANPEVMLGDYTEGGVEVISMEYMEIFVLTLTPDPDPNPGGTSRRDRCDICPCCFFKRKKWRKMELRSG